MQLKVNHILSSKYPEGYKPFADESVDEDIAGGNMRKIHNENVLDNIPYGIVAINNECRVNTFNKSASRMLNMSQDDVLGKDVTYIGSLFANFLLRTLKDKKIYKMEKAIHPITHTIYDISTDLLEDTIKELGAIMIFADLSEVKKLVTKIMNLENLIYSYSEISGNTIPGLERENE